MDYAELAYSIVIQAVKDYREYVRDGKSVKELVRFFEGDWCRFLLAESSITGEEILAKLRLETA